MTIVMRMLPAVSMVGLLAAGAAHAETTAGARVGVEGGYGSNPLLGNNDQSAGPITGRIEPTVTIAGPTSQLSAYGRLEHIVFTDNYKDMTNWSLGSTVGLTLGPRSKLSVTGGYSSLVQSALLSTDPLPGEDQPDIDPSTGELGGRRVKQLNGNASFSSQISARNDLTISAFVTDVNYASAALAGDSYTAYGGSIGVSHTLNARTSLGVSVSYSKSKYDTAASGDFRQISPSANVTIRLSPQLTLNASAGVSFSHITQLGFGSDQTNFSGEAQLCYKGSRSDLCVSASRSVGSTIRSGNSTITTAGANYSYRLTPRSSLTANVQYSESNSLEVGAGRINLGYGVATAAYQRELGRRLSFSLTARYTEPFKSVSGRRKGFYGGAGLNYRLGR